MTFTQTLVTILEFLAGGLIIWGILNERKLVAFEDKIFAAIKRKIRGEAVSKRDGNRAGAPAARRNTAAAVRQHQHGRTAAGTLRPSSFAKSASASHSRQYYSERNAYTHPVPVTREREGEMRSVPTALVRAEHVRPGGSQRALRLNHNQKAI